MHNIDFQCENIFSKTYWYKIHCIGKCTKGITPVYQNNHYYFVSHNKKYVASEFVRGLDDISVVVKEVDEFEVPDSGGTEYFLCQKEVEERRYKCLKGIENRDDIAYNKDGFFAFKQAYYQDGNATFGGIDDIYKYEKTNKRNFKKVLKTCEYEK